MIRLRGFRFIALLSTLFVAFSLASTDFADARKGGSFGSRGTRTFQAPPATRTAPNQAAPVERTMTPAPAPNAAARPQAANPQRPGMFGGFGGSLMRGLLVGGLIGMLMGYGFGGLAGAMGFIVQLLLIGGLTWLALAFFRSRGAPAAAGGAPSPAAGRGMGFDPARREAAGGAQAAPKAGGFSIPSIGSGSSAQSAAAASQDITLDQADLDTFERMLGEVQDAFAREDHGALRRLSTPEMVSFFSEELADNAQRGVRNEVRDVRLVQADIAEAWREGAADYATAALRYEAIDILRDRATGAVVGGSEEPSEAVELWTFTRQGGGDWKLSAIQDA